MTVVAHRVGGAQPGTWRVTPGGQQHVRPNGAAAAVTWLRLVL